MNLAKKLYKDLVPDKSSFQFFLWKYRHIIEMNFGSDSIHPDDFYHPHRLKILDMLKKENSSFKLMEIGCGKGHNLFLFSEKFPGSVFTGVDINKKCIRTANGYAARNKIPNVHFFYKNLLDLKQFDDKQFDVVITDAVLIYVDAQIIHSFAKELTRISKKRIVLVEFFDENTTGSGYSVNKCWTRNYKALFKEYAEDIKMENVEAGSWTANWEKYGRYIDIVLK